MLYTSSILDIYLCLLRLQQTCKNVSEYIDYTKPGENHNTWFSMEFVVSLFSSVESYYMYDVVPTYLVYDEYSGLLACTLGSTFVSGCLLASHVSPLNSALLMTRSL